MEVREPLEATESEINEPFIEAYSYAGPTLVVVPGIEMSINDFAERLDQRAAMASEILYNRVINGVVEYTVTLSTGGHTSKSPDMFSEAETLLFNMGRHLENLTAGTGVNISLYGVDAATLSLDDGILAPQEIAQNHWAIPVYVDTKASSLVENFKFADHDLFNDKDTLIAIAAGSARPSSLRAGIVAEMLYPDSQIEALRAKDGSQYSRIRKALLDEGIIGALKESYPVEAILALATRMGAGEFLNKFTQKRINQD